MRSGGSTIRQVLTSSWQNHAGEWIFEIEANAFLYRMVRRLVYVQIAAGQARISTETLIQALDGTPEERQNAQALIPGGLAPACGLTLVNVRYDDLN
jgi:tRNA pseudouridine38-40 synthase